MISTQPRFVPGSAIRDVCEGRYVAHTSTTIPNCSPGSFKIDDSTVARPQTRTTRQEQVLLFPAFQVARKCSLRQDLWTPSLQTDYPYHRLRLFLMVKIRRPCGVANESLVSASTSHYGLLGQGVGGIPAPPCKTRTVRNMVGTTRAWTWRTSKVNV